MPTKTLERIVRSALRTIETITTSSRASIQPVEYLTKREQTGGRTLQLIQKRILTYRFIRETIRNTGEASRWENFGVKGEIESRGTYKAIKQRANTAEARLLLYGGDGSVETGGVE